MQHFSTLSICCLLLKFLSFSCYSEYFPFFLVLFQSENFYHVLCTLLQTYFSYWLRYRIFKKTVQMSQRISKGLSLRIKYDERTFIITSLCAICYFCFLLSVVLQLQYVLMFVDLLPGFLSNLCIIPHSCSTSISHLNTDKVFTRNYRDLQDTASMT